LYRKDIRMRPVKEPLVLKSYYHDNRSKCSFRILASNNVKPTMIVLDAGCGKRSVIGEEKLKAHKTVGLEASIDDLQLNSTVDLRVVGNLVNIPFKQGIFDLIVCRNVVEHLERPQEVFIEFNRLLKSGGLLMVRTPNKFNPIMFLSAILPLNVRTWIKKNLFYDTEGDTFPTYYRCNSMGRMNKTLKRCGFQRTSTAYDGLMTYFNFSKILVTTITIYERITDLRPLNIFKMWLIASFRKV